MKKPFRFLSAGIGLLALLGVPAARAQVGTGTIIEADIPFAFHAGEAQLPPGEYRLRVPDDSDASLMEIWNVQPGGGAAFFQVIATQDRRPAAESALVFQKYGDTYYLRRIAEEGTTGGDELPVSRSEKSLRKELSLGERSAELRVPARSPSS